VLGLISLASLLLATPAQAAPDQFGPRAGSVFSGTASQYGQTSKRPYRRRQPPQPKEFAAKFDYRLENASAAESFSDDYADPTSVQVAGYCDCGDVCSCGDSMEAGCGCDDYCEPNCGCDDSYCTNGCCTSLGSCGSGTLWTAGFEWSFVKPRFSENAAFTTFDSDGNANDIFTTTEFNYDLELSPRVWIEAQISNGWSWRLSYWQFDHNPSTVTASPNDGFDEITHPPFGDVDISANDPTESLTASSGLNAYTIDLEALKQARLSGWQLGVGGGVRYASVEQNYVAQLRNGNNVIGQIDFTHGLDGFGPTIFLSAKRPLFRKIQLVCAARGSLLFGDGESRLFATEDTTPSTTLRLTNRDDLLPIGEARVGLEWLSPPIRRSGFQWLISSAMEGQIWGNAGNATSETADLGFFGFNVGAGFVR